MALTCWRTRTGRYGPAPQNSDSAVNILLDVVADQSGKTYRMDHYATRYPTNVLDIADFLVRLSGASTFRCLPLLIPSWRGGTLP